jgi:hypothetical protein
VSDIQEPYVGPPSSFVPGGSVPPPPPPPGWQPAPPPWQQAAALSPYGVGSPAPGYGYPPAQRPRRTGWIVGGVAVAVLVVVAIVAAVVVFTSNARGAKSVVNSYLTALQGGQYSQAYAALCPADQLRVSETQFATAKAAVHPVSFAIAHVALHTKSGAEVAYVYYQDNESNGFAVNGMLPAVKLGGTWSVCHSATGETWIGVG